MKLQNTTSKLEKMTNKTSSKQTGKLERIASSVKSTTKNIVDSIKNNAKVYTMLGASILGGYAAEKAYGDQLYIDFKNSVSGVSRSNLSIKHTEGATEILDSAPIDYGFFENSAPALDLWSQVNFDPYKLSKDSRPSNSMTTVNAEINGRGLTAQVSNELRFQISDSKGENNFANKNIFIDLYDAKGTSDPNDDTIIETYDAKNLASTGTTIPITIGNGLSYTLKVRFEPSQFSLAELATLANNWLQLCDNSNNKCGGLGEDGEVLNLEDFAYWAGKWNPTSN